MTLFELPEARAYDPPARKTVVRSHERTLTPRARRTDPQTSRDAAASITPGRTEKRILEVLHDLELTADEIGERLPDVYGPTLRSALARLHTSGFVVETGEVRASNRGRPSSVWRLA